MLMARGATCAQELFWHNPFSFGSLIPGGDCVLNLWAVFLLEQSWPMPFRTTLRFDGLQEYALAGHDLSFMSAMLHDDSTCNYYLASW
mmetsp:Transcript_19034/g.39400  ORF Transcript_19034/g.39400 Transcript_19034/m.39400 type:complete len:88 (+) Transcript_19034:995-1258(+)